MYVLLKIKSANISETVRDRAISRLFLSRKGVSSILCYIFQIFKFWRPSWISSSFFKNRKYLRFLKMDYISLIIAPTALECIVA